MGASITLAGESLIAQKQAAQLGLDVVRFIFANVPGLDPGVPIDRAAPKPATGQIVHVYDIPAGSAGYVNPNQVVYSSQIGSDVGDWDFNWIGLETAEGTLLAVATVALQQKRRNIPPLQIGNNLTRNFLVAFDGAQALTGITIDASTWQHDFTVRLAGIDERERLSNRDVYGRACFFGSSLQVEKVGGVYQVKPGTAYVEGIRLQRSAALAVVPPAFPTTAWLDVSLQRELSDVVASWKVVFAADKADYTDSAGVRHYCVAIADLPNANTVTDRRSVEAIDGPLVGYFAARTGDYPNLRARATTKDDVGLGNLPNAKSDSFTLEDSESLASSKALAMLWKSKSDSLTLDDSESLASSKAVATLWKSICVNISSFSADKVLTAAHRGLVVVDASAGNRTITLPSANAALGVLDFIIRRADNTVNRLVVQANGAEKIKFHTHLNAAGYSFLVLMGAGDFWHLRSDGAGNWWPVSRHDSDAVGRPVFETTVLFSPGGWGALNGYQFNRAEWPWLWDHAQQSGMLTTEAGRIGMSGGWTSGDGALTFRGPEGRGEFMRVLDEGRAVDAGRVAGSWQKGSAHSFDIGPGTGVVGDRSGTTTATASRADIGYDAGLVADYPTVQALSVAGSSIAFISDTAEIAWGTARPRNIAYPGRIKLI
ncbi:phage tail protein [Pseudomonas fluorescens]|uniref:phage tail-collar fiber domain-containing protein n=1 Tax=Pseudomonas fluorescens TaxID=294 RepID=UPI00191286C4|nr:phage tail protein [Pseudomonas fluorescens]